MPGKPWKIVLIASVLALATGCGGGRPAQAPPPVFPRAVAHDLAGRSDRVAASLTQGNSCAAAVAAADLQQTAHNAVDSGRVPVAFRPRLLTAVDALAASLPACPPPSNEEGDGGGQGKHKGKDKHGKGGGD